MLALTLLSNKFGQLIQKFFSLTTGEIYHGYGSNLKLKNYPMPSLKGIKNDNVVIKTSLCCICGTDLLKISQKNNFLKRFNSIKRNGEIFLGHEVVGTIVEIKKLKQKDFMIGDRVILIEQNNCKTISDIDECLFCKSGMPLLCANKYKRKYTDVVYGGLSEYFVRNEFQIFKISPKVSDKAACLIEPASIAYKAAMAVNLAKGNRILLIGSGVISLISIKILRLLYGDKIIIHVIARHEFQSKEAIIAGANKVYNHYSIDEISKDLTSNIIGSDDASYLNIGYDSVIDYVGSAETTNQSLSVIKSRSTIVIVGFNNALVKVGFDHLIQREIRLIGIHGYDSSNEKNTKLAAFQKIIEYIEKDMLYLDDYVSNIFKIEDFKAGFKKAHSHFKIRDNSNQIKCFRVGLKF